MKLRGALSFVLVASLALACDPDPDPDPSPNDAGPDQSDGGSNPGTGDGGSNPGTGDAGVVTDTLTIQGRVIDAPGAQAEITATVGTETYVATAGTDGSFSLDIVRPRTAPATNWVILTARATGSHPVVLKASLGEIGQLTAAAGADRVLTRQEHNNTYLTHLTTAQYALLTESHGATPPMNRADTRAAEKEIDSRKVLQRAAVLKLVTNDPARYPLPAGMTSTLALVQNLAAYKGFVTQHAAAVEAAEAPLLAEPDTVAQFKLSEMPSAYYAVAGTREGYLPRGGSKIVLRAAGSGDYLNTTGKHPFTWSVTSGALVLNFSPPVPEKTYPFVAGCPDQGQLETTFNIQQHRYQLLADGAYVEQAQLTLSGERTYAQCIDGTQLPPVSHTESVSTPLRDADQLPPLMLTVSNFAGITWGLDQYFPYGEAGEVGLGTDLVSFAGNATGSARQGGATFTWQVTNGRLVLTYPDGSRHHFEWLESLPPLEAFFSERTDSAGRVLSANYNTAIARRPAAAFSPELLVTAAGTYWQTGVNTGMAAGWEGDEISWDMRFGWELRATSATDRLDFFLEPDNDDGDSIPKEKFIIRVSHTWSMLDAQTVRLDSTQMCNGAPCRRRNWYLLDVSPANQRIYVLEELFFRFNSSPVGVFTTLSPPRWNLYEKWPVPPSDVYGP